MDIWIISISWLLWINIGIQISLQDLDFNFFEYIPRRGIVGSHGNFISTFFRTSTLFFKWLHRFTFSLILHKNSNFSITSSIFLLFCFLANSYPNRCEMIPHLVLICISLMFSEKVGLKFNIQKTKIMASGSITSWQIDGKTVETVTDVILGGSKITADDGCSHEIKRRLLLGRKVITNLDSILKTRDITLPTKVCLSKLWFFK